MRDFDTIDSELRLLVAVRRTVQEPDGRTASTRLIRKTDKRRVYLSAEDVRRLADESGEHRALVLLLAYCGLRWGEAIGLRVRDVEFLRRRLAVHENAVQLGMWHAVGPTKGRKARSVPAPTFVLDELSVQCAGKAPTDLVFAASDGGYLPRPKSSNGWFTRAVKPPEYRQSLRTICATHAHRSRYRPG